MKDTLVRPAVTENYMQGFAKPEARCSGILSPIPVISWSRTIVPEPPSIGLQNASPARPLQMIAGRTELNSAYAQ